MEKINYQIKDEDYVYTFKDKGLDHFYCPVNCPTRIRSMSGYKSHLRSERHKNKLHHNKYIKLNLINEMIEDN